jgi:protein-tyrosine phosphatase
MFFWGKITYVMAVERVPPNMLHFDNEEDKESFSLSILKVGKGSLSICRLPGRYGNLDSDLEIVEKWAPNLVVSMTTESEFKQSTAGDLPGRLSEAGIEWIHLPIEGFGAPEKETMIAWPAVSLRIQNILDGGGKVLLHCRGGQGRSGMIALRLLIEIGENPSDALKRLRIVRPGAVETSEQLQWSLAPSKSRQEG